MYSVVAVVLLALAVSAKLNFKDCGGLNNVQSVVVSACDGNNCPLKLGSTVQIKAVFKGVTPATQLYSTIKGRIRGRDMNFPQPRIDACKTDRISPGCPIKPGQTYTYKDTFEIKNFFPPGPVGVTYGGVNENNEMVACALVNAVIEK